MAKGDAAAQDTPRLNKAEMKNNAAAKAAAKQTSKTAEKAEKAATKAAAKKKAAKAAAKHKSKIAENAEKAAANQTSKAAEKAKKAAAKAAAKAVAEEKKAKTAVASPQPQARSADAGEAGADDFVDQLLQQLQPAPTSHPHTASAAAAGADEPSADTFRIDAADLSMALALASVMPSGQFDARGVSALLHC